MNYIVCDKSKIVAFPKSLKKESKLFFEELFEFFKDDIFDKQWVLLDAKELEDISFYGLRQLFSFHEKSKKTIILNLSNEMFDKINAVNQNNPIYLFKEFEQIDISDCELLGSGQNGSVYKKGEDTVIKVYNHLNSFIETLNEFIICKWAYANHLPTTITLRLGLVNDLYAMEYEYTTALALSKYLVDDPNNIDLYVDEYVKAIKKLSLIKADTNLLVDKKQEYIDKIEFLKSYLTEEEIEKLTKIINSIPNTDTVVHGDLHTRNLRYADGETLIIDMGTLGYGHPIFEMICLYATYVSYQIVIHNDVIKIGDLYPTLWQKLRDKYFEGYSKEEIQKQENIFAALAYCRVYKHCIKIKNYEESALKLLRESLQKIS